MVRNLPVYDATCTSLPPACRDTFHNWRAPSSARTYDSGFFSLVSPSEGTRVPRGSSGSDAVPIPTPATRTDAQSCRPILKRSMGARHQHPT